VLLPMRLFTLMMEAVKTSEALMNLNQSTRRYNPEKAIFKENYDIVLRCH
jgi:hypothetical protein